MINFVVPGPPVGKARARVTKWGAFTPEKTLNYEALVKQIYTYDIKGPYHEGALRMTIQAFYEIPKSTPKKNIDKMIGGDIRPTKKPDIDNIAKIISDALNGIAYKDDTQIVDLRVTKYFSGVPSVQVQIEKLEE